MANLPTYGRDEVTVTALEALTPLADFDGGLNLGASNAPGIGICTDVVNPKLTDWSVLDQFENARDPQDSQHLGGDGLGAGLPTTAPIQGVLGADINDTVSFLVADQQAAPGVIFHIASGAVNRGTTTVEIGQRVWGLVPVA